MNLKAYLPIIALCAVTFAVSFAGGLWWEMSQQDEWGTSESSGQDVNQSIAKRQADKEKTKSDKEGQTDTEQEKATDGEKDKPEKTAEGSENHPVHAAPNVSPTAVPSKAKRVRGGRKRMDMNNMSPEMRAKVEEAKEAAQKAAALEGGREISTVEISGEGPADGEVIIEPDN